MESAVLSQANRGGCPKRHREGAPERGERQAKRRSSWHFRVQEVGETQCFDMRFGHVLRSTAKRKY